MGEVSGGERRRLQLLRLLMTEPNVLLLDEPTNDLDTDTLAAVEDILDSFPGTLVVVSHDRYLLERVTDHQVALLGDGALRDLPGGVEQYLRLRREAVVNDDAAEGRGGASGSRARGGGAAAGSAGTVAGAGDGRALSGAGRREAQKSLARIERRLERAGRTVDALHARLEAASADPARLGELAELGRELAAAEDARSELETAWLETAEELQP